MKLIAHVTIEPGSVKPGEPFEIKDKAEAESLIERGLARAAPEDKVGREKPKGDKSDSGNSAGDSEEGAQ